MQTQRIMIVGTTADYIELLRKKYPPRSLFFVTASKIRENATEERPEPDEELICELDKFSYPAIIINLINQHIRFYNILLNGIACFDCESMALTANIASAFSLPYTSIEAVMACRDKSLTRKLWQTNSVPTPKYARVSSAAQAVDFFQSVQILECKKQNKTTSCVLKPIDSSGSERVFRCSTPKECETAYNIICAPQQSPDIIIETCVEGVEYSCDFIIGSKEDLQKMPFPKYTVGEHDVIVPIRFTRKIPSPINVFGTTMAYEIVDFSMMDNNLKSFSDYVFISLLAKAAKAVGITRSICMLDFIVLSDSATNDGKNEKSNGTPKNNNDNKDNNDKFYDEFYNNISFIEIAPRPGGDCLPWLIQKSMNIDILKLTIDFAENNCVERDFGFDIHSDIDSNSLKFNSSEISQTSFYDSLVGLRIHATQAGILKHIDTKNIESDPRVREIYLKHQPGHKVILPPQNYDSWNLGHIIFKPFHNIACKNQCIELLSMLKTTIV